MYPILAAFGAQGMHTLEIVGQIVYFVLVFAAVVALTVVSTKWIAGTRYRRASAGNLQIVESIAVGQQAYLQLVRVGSKYIVIGVSRGNVSFVCEVEESEVTLPEIKMPGESVVLDKFERYLNAYRDQKSSKDQSGAGTDTKEQ
ncbi:MAG: flagellar biosynthetic protein FliO [Defluviitaleaceae bacterium]|nr:flagellar biosynthetic protein FliO [Defluviitaleaceae bacterium]